MLGKKSVKVTLFVSMLTLMGLALPLQASAECKLVSTKDGSPLPIKPVDTDHQKLSNSWKPVLTPIPRCTRRILKLQKPVKRNLVITHAPSAMALMQVVKLDQVLLMTVGNMQNMSQTKACLKPYLAVVTAVCLLGTNKFPVIRSWYQLMIS